jgi:hypothetical protein
METNFSTPPEVPGQPFVQNQADTLKANGDENCLNPSYPENVDEQGSHLESRAALELKRGLLDRLSVLKVPEHPLDQLVNYFGTENVAEMTGRKKRLIRTLAGRL